jgi:hypothetical protein
MIGETQRDALAVLAEIWALSPDVRLGQLFAHIGFLADVHLGKDIGYPEDGEIIAIMKRHRTELLAHLQHELNQTTPS